MFVIVCVYSRCIYKKKKEWLGYPRVFVWAEWPCSMEIQILVCCGTEFLVFVPVNFYVFIFMWHMISVIHMQTTGRIFSHNFYCMKHRLTRLHVCVFHTAKFVSNRMLSFILSVCTMGCNLWNIFSNIWCILWLLVFHQWLESLPLKFLVTISIISLP